ncbi:MAG TPA: DmsC/YnfH family molybdoenzyme membrane anchor subunit [Usitatibacter sp.]|jgi:DMSO reductase anchor subunit|nr:DmsC/YnfH family molybdoenzyme membrane anchor subunit [Usitatibacter sp.]
MRPAYSVVFLTTLIGAGQGLFVAAFMAEAVARLAGESVPTTFLVRASIGIVALGAGGLVASFFHLGRPERAWRSAAMWRTSWLSREVIALPAFIALAAAYGLLHARGHGGTFLVGLLALAACIALFTCTAMIYACIRFLQEWASPLTFVNFVLMGCASGFTLAAALAAWQAPALLAPFTTGAIALTLAALVSRVASLKRNARLQPRSTTQSAIGARGPDAVQKSRGFTGGSFNTREFFHGVGAPGMRAILAAFLALAFVVPVALIVAGRDGAGPWLALAFAVQYTGLVAERWYFLADARHPQNLYYQSVA